MATKKAKVTLSEQPNGRPVLQVVVSKGTTVKGATKVIGNLDAIIERLTGCPCLSGLDLRLFDNPLTDKAKSFNQEFGLPG